MAAFLLGSATAKLLFCAWGFGGHVVSPSDPDTFAEAVVQINSPDAIKNAKISNFRLFDRAQHSVPMSALLDVERFDRVAQAGENPWAYDAPRNRVGSRQWNQTLPSGNIYLFIRVALIESPPDAASSRCSVTVGPYTMERALDGAWPSY
jgi:hypothetical protein